MALRLVIVALSIFSVIKQINAATCFIPAPGLPPELAKALLAYAKPVSPEDAPPAHVKPPPFFPKRTLSFPNAFRKMTAPVPVLSPALTHAAPAPIPAQAPAIPPALLHALISSLINQQAPVAPPAPISPVPEVPAPMPAPPPPPPPAPAAAPASSGITLDPALVHALLKNLAISPPESCPCSACAA